MLPLTFAEIGTEVTIQLVKGKPETKKHLEDLGFGNLIVNVKETRLGLDQSMASKIMI